jgi:hypothetical protein
VKLTFLWQWKYYPEREWIARLFEPFAGEQVYDCEHRIVLDNCLLIDAYLHAHPAGYFSRFRGKNAWLLHLCDETYEGGYRNYDNFRGVFRCYWSDIFNPRRVMHLPLGYCAGFQGGAVEPGTARRPYLWSFLGGAGRSSRPEMIQALLPLKPHFLHVTDRGDVQRLGKAQYEQVLRDSVFVPSSMGNVNLESFRIYEALECGAIPILEKRWGLDYFTSLFGSHPLPAFTSWGKAARFVEGIRNDREALDRLQSQCQDWWHGYKQSLRERIEEMFVSPPGAEAGSFIHWRRSVPGSQAIELARHHTFPALLRRAKVQTLRAIHEGKLRKTTGA